MRPEKVELESSLAAPRAPGRYRLAFDLVEEFRFWFHEVGSSPLEVPVDVRPRIDERRLAVRVHGELEPELEAAIAAQEERVVTEGAVAVAHLVPGVIPARDWSRLLLDAHAEGYGAVGGAIARVASDRRELRARAPEAVATGCEPPLLLALDASSQNAPGLPSAPSEMASSKAAPSSTSVAIRSSERLKTSTR